MVQNEAQLVFDGRCGFCTRSVEWLLARCREPFHAVPWQSISLGELGLTEREVQRAAFWIEPTGRRFEGAQAVARALQACGGVWAVLGTVLRIPPFSWLARLGYRVVARYRRHLPGATPACKRDHWQGRSRGDGSA